MLERQRSIEEAVAATRSLHLPPSEQQKLLQEQQQKASYTGGNKRAARKKNKKDTSELAVTEKSTGYNHIHNMNNNDNGLQKLPNSNGPDGLGGMMMHHDMSYDYKKILEMFVTQNFQSQCRFVNNKIYEPPGYVCKVN